MLGTLLILNLLKRKAEEGSEVRCAGTDSLLFSLSGTRKTYFKDCGRSCNDPINVMFNNGVVITVNLMFPHSCKETIKNNKVRTAIKGANRRRNTS